MIRTILRSLLLTRDEKNVLVWHEMGRNKTYLAGDVIKRTNLLAGDVFSALYVLEHVGVVSSEWLDEKSPRRRLYRRTDR